MAKIVGCRRVDYVSRRTSNPVKGYSFFMTEGREGIVGEAAFDCFLSDERASDFMGQFKTLPDVVGLEVDIRYDRFGHPTELTLI